MVRAIDLFAGWGGFTLAAEAAGVDVVYAANHCPVAVEVHAANHPRARHECQDLRQADWTKLPRYDLLLASPACQGHSTASQPKRRQYHDALRATAWAVVDCAEVTQPRALVIENVPAFRQWQLFPLWREALSRLGYHLTEHVVTASRHGVPQRRERLFITGTRTGGGVVLEPGATEPAFGPCIEWDAPARWHHVRDAAPNAQVRIEKGRANHGRTFLSQHVTGHPGVPLDEPIRTITTKDQWILVDGDRYRALTLRELARGMGFPETYRWPDRLTRKVVVQGLGNAVCPAAGRDVVNATLRAEFGREPPPASEVA